MVWTLIHRLYVLTSYKMAQEIIGKPLSKALEFLNEGEIVK